MADARANRLYVGSIVLESAIFNLWSQRYAVSHTVVRAPWTLLRSGGSDEASAMFSLWNERQACSNLSGGVDHSPE